MHEVEHHDEYHKQYAHGLYDIEELIDIASSEEMMIEVHKYIEDYVYEAYPAYDPSRIALKIGAHMASVTQHIGDKYGYHYTCKIHCKYEDVFKYILLLKHVSYIVSRISAYPIFSCLFSKYLKPLHHKLFLHKYEHSEVNQCICCTGQHEFDQYMTKTHIF